jgi:hypothetical protein
MITTAVMTKRKRSEHYVNNKEFLAALIKYREDVEITFIQKYGREPTKDDRSQRWETKTSHSSLHWRVFPEDC